MKYLCLAVVAALGLSMPAEAQTRTLKVGHGLSAASHPGAAATAISETLAAKLPGKFKVELFPNFSLGDERQMVEGTVLGNVDIAIVSTGPMGNFVPDHLLLDLPFLFRDNAHARGVLDSPIGQRLLDKCAPKGFVCLAWSENGFRHLTNSKKPIVTLQDLEGLKIRTMENDFHIQTFKSLRALPTPISGAEVYSALQQHTVDGQENPLGNIGIMKLPQVQKYLTLSGHFYSPHVVVVSGSLWASLTPAEREAFTAAARAGAAAARRKVEEQDERWLADLKTAGMIVNALAPEQKAAFAKAVEPVYENARKRFGAENVDQIRAWK